MLAAASLRESLTSVARAYEHQHPGTQISLSFAGSQQLAAQLVLGAPADVFASADDQQMKRVNAGGRVRRGDVKLLVFNRLVLVVAKRSAAKIGSLGDLGSPGIKLVLAANEVPAGHYARQTLLKAAASQPRGWFNRATGNLVSNELDVRAALAKVELGDADAAIVYETDAKSAAGKVVRREIPAAVNVTAAYLVAPVDGSSEGRSFVKFVLGPVGRKALREAGFALPKP